MPRKEKPKKSDAELVAEGRKILDEVDKMDPKDPSLAPFRTKNWLDKGKGMLRGLQPVPDKEAD